MPFITDPELQQLQVTESIEKRAEDLAAQAHELPVADKWTMPKSDEDEPTFGETVGAAFSEENIIGSTVSYLSDKEGQDFKDDYEFNVFDEDLSGYEDYLDEFDDVYSPKEMAFVKKRIDTGLENRKILAESGGMGITAMIAAGILDPTTFIPIGGVVYKFGKTGGAVYNAAKTAGQVGAIEVGREAILHQTQPVRTLEESAINVGGATVLSGILGGVAGHMSRARYDEIAKDIDGYVDEVMRSESIPVHGDAGAARVIQTTMEQETMVGGKLAEMTTLGPSGYLASSPSYSARIISQNLADSSILLKKHQEGIAPPRSLEIMIKSHEAELDDTIRLLKGSWEQYKKRVPFGTRAFKSYKDFDEAVAFAMRRGDEHIIPEVKTAAKYFRKRFESVKEQAIAARLLPDDVTPLGALSYLPRSYNARMIVDNINDFRRELRTQVLPNLTEDFVDEVDDYVDKIIENILGEGSVERASIVTNTSPLKGRKLDMTDEFLEKWLDSSAHNLYAQYHRAMIPRIEFVNKFGDDTLESMLEEVMEDYRKLSREVNTPKQQQKLKNRKNEDVANIKAIYNRAMGQQDVGLDRSGGLYRSLAATKEWSRGRLLGGVTISSLSDIARPIIVNGIGRYSAMIYKVATNPAFAKLAMAEKRRMAAALEITMQSRELKRAEIFDDAVGHTKFERGLKYVGEKFTTATLLPYHNSLMKTMVGLLTEDKIIRFAQKLNTGKRVSQKEIQRLARLGIDSDTAKRISEQYSKHGETKDGLTLGNFHLWEDEAARVAINDVIIRTADETINTPGFGTLPKFFDKTGWQALMQFKSFLYASHMQTLHAGLQQADTAFVSSVVAMVGMGVLVTELKDVIADRDKSRTPQELLLEGVDRSGVLSFPLELNNILDKTSGHNISLNAMIGGNEAKRYASRSKMEAIMGPNYALANDALSVMEIIGGKEMKRSDLARYRKLLPFQNLFYTRQILDELEDGLGDAMGMRKK